VQPIANLLKILGLRPFGRAVECPLYHALRQAIPCKVEEVSTKELVALVMVRRHICVMLLNMINGLLALNCAHTKRMYSADNHFLATGLKLSSGSAKRGQRKWESTSKNYL